MTTEALLRYVGRSRVASEASDGRGGTSERSERASPASRRPGGTEGRTRTDRPFAAKAALCVPAAAWPSWRLALAAARPRSAFRHKVPSAGTDVCRFRPVERERTDELAEEQALCERAKRGDRDALGTLLSRHGPRLYRSVLLPRLGSPAAAEEALSTTYIKVVERFEQFSWQNVGVYPWLRVVALRVALDQLRSRKRELLFEPNDLERELDGAERDARDAAALERHDLELARRRVEQMLGRVNPRYATAIRLRVLEERSREHAAAELGVSVSTFDVVLHRAMAALRKVLSSADEGDES
jgi:RNA polymerase sigma-70 factor, ECF subfamily